MKDQLPQQNESNEEKSASLNGCDSPHEVASLDNVDTSLDHSDSICFNDFSTCGVCQKTFKQPRVLFCLHAFCEECLVSLLDGGRSQAQSGELSNGLTDFALEPKVVEEAVKPGVIKCPLCNQESNIGMDARALQMLLPDFVSINKQDSASILRMEVLCNSCKSKEKAVARCSDCASFLCPNCVQAHQFMRCFENHKVVTFEDMKSSGEINKIHKPAYCPAHPAEIMRFFCNTCDFPVCNECMVLTHKPPYHQHEKISDELEIRVRNEIGGLVNDGKSKVAICQDESQHFEKLRYDLQSHVEAAREAIQETYQQYQLILGRVQQEMMEELDRVHNRIEGDIMSTCTTVENTMERIGDGCKFADRLLEHGNAIELLAFKRMVRCQLLHLTNAVPTNRNIRVNIQFATDQKDFENSVKLKFGRFAFAPPQRKAIVMDPLARQVGGAEFGGTAGVLHNLPNLQIATNQDFAATGGLVRAVPMAAGEGIANATHGPSPFGFAPGGQKSLTGTRSTPEQGGVDWGVSATSQESSVRSSATPNPFAGHPYLDPENAKKMEERYAPDRLGSFVNTTASPTGSTDSGSKFVSTGGFGAAAQSTREYFMIKGSQFVPAGGQSAFPFNVTAPSFSAYPMNTAAANVSVPPPSAFSMSTTTAAGRNAYSFGDNAASLGAAGNAPTGGFGNAPTGGFGNAPTGGFGTFNASAGGFASGNTYGPPGGYMSHTSPPGLSRQGKQNPMQLQCKFGSQGSSLGQFNSPHGFCLGVNEDICIADTNNHRIQVFAQDGEFKYQFGVAGKEEGQLWYPRKVAVMRGSGNFVICDRGVERSRMQVFTHQGIFLRRIDYYVSQKRYVEIVAGLSISEEGHIVACDSVNPTVFALSEMGEVVRWFDCSEHMREPSDIAVSGGEFYVCDFKAHFVAVFNEEGQFLRRFGSEQITHFPNGIDVSDAGDVLVGDSHGNRFHVAVFSKQGQLTAEFECQQIKVSRCCGLKITSEGRVVTLAKNNHQVLIMGTLYIT